MMLLCTIERYFVVSKMPKRPVHSNLENSAHPSPGVEVYVVGADAAGEDTPPWASPG